MVEREFIPLNIGILRVLETGAIADDADVEAIVGRLAEAGHHLAARETVTDSKSLIREQITMWIGDRGIDVIVVIGGIDSTPTDPMLDALAPLVSRQFFGFGELFRAIIHEEAGTASIFSHAEAALCSSTYVILLPATGFTPSAIERLLIPQLDHRTKPRNLAMSLPRLAGVPLESMGGDTPPASVAGRVAPAPPPPPPPPPPRTKTGLMPIMHVPPANPSNPSRIAVAPPSSQVKRPTAQIPAVTESVVRRPPTTPGIAPIVDEPAKPRNPFADALKEAAQVRRTSSIVAQMPTKPVAVEAPPPEPVPAVPSVVVAPPEPPTVDLSALEESADGTPLLTESTSGTIDMDALLSAATASDDLAEPVPPARVVPAPRVTVPPPFVPRTTTSQLAVVPAAEPRRTATAQVAAVTEVPPQAPVTVARADGDFRELATTPQRERERGSPRMFVEGRRKRITPPRLAVILLLVVAGLSAIAAGVVVYVSMMHKNASAAEPRPPPPPPPPPVALIDPPDAAVAPEHDPIAVDATNEIEMPVTEPIDAGALALKPPINPARPVHDPIVPRDAPEGPAIPMHDDGCDEVSCVLDHYAKSCCARFKPAEPDPATLLQPTKLDRSMVQPAIEAIKPLVIACGERHNAPKGTVKLAVHVGRNGHVTFVTVAETPDPQLGDCVSAAMQRAVFPATQAGGGFTYPFVF